MQYLNQEFANILDLYGDDITRREYDSIKEKPVHSRTLEKRCNGWESAKREARRDDWEVGALVDSVDQTIKRAIEVRFGLAMPSPPSLRLVCSLDPRIYLRSLPPNHPILHPQ